MPQMSTPSGAPCLVEAVREYHDLLEGPAGLCEATREELTDQLNRSRFVFGGRLLSPYLRPHFVSRQQFKRIRAVCERVWRSVTIVADHALQDDQMKDYLGFSEDELKLFALDPGYRGVSRTSRLDSFLSEENYQFVELNAESPAGIAYSDVASETFLNLEVMRQFQKRYRLTAMSGRQRLLDVLLAAYTEFSPAGGRPRIAIVDFRGLPTEREFELFKEFFESRGYPTVIADPRDLVYSRGRLRCGDFEIDLIYKRVLVNEYLEKIREAPALFEAYRDRAVCVVNSFRGKIVHKKLLFGILTDERFERYFPSGEREFLAQHIPWSRRVEDRKTYFRGRPIDLLEWARANRSGLVLKPNDEYGGKGILLGWLSTEDEWVQALESALRRHFILQERVSTPHEIFPCIMEDGTVEFAEQLVDLDPLLFDGIVGSAFTRLSGSALCNVTAGGGMVPTYIVEGHTA